MDCIEAYVEAYIYNAILNCDVKKHFWIDKKVWEWFISPSKVRKLKKKKIYGLILGFAYPFKFYVSFSLIFVIKQKYLFFFLFKITYLRNFKKLKTLNLGNNPFCELENYKPYVAAFLPFLEFLDYRLLDDQTVISLS